MNGSNSGPREMVYSNSLIMGEVFSYLDKKEVIKCLTLSKAVFGDAAKGIYKDVPEDLPKRLIDVNCPHVRYNIYIASTSSVKLSQPHLPIDVPIKSLQDRFPYVMALKFHLPYEGMRAEVSRDAAQEFTELHIWCNKKQDWNIVNLTKPAYGLGGSTPQFHLKTLRLSNPSGTSGRGTSSHNYGNLEIMGISGNTYTSLDIPAELRTILSDVHTVQLQSTELDMQEAKTLIPLLPNARIVVLYLDTKYELRKDIFTLLSTFCSSLEEAVLQGSDGLANVFLPCVSPFFDGVSCRPLRLALDCSASGVMILDTWFGNACRTISAAGPGHQLLNCTGCRGSCLSKVDRLDLRVKMDVPESPNEYTFAITLHRLLGSVPVLNLRPIKYQYGEMPTMSRMWGKHVVDTYNMLKHPVNAVLGFRKISKAEVASRSIARPIASGPTNGSAASTSSNASTNAVAPPTTQASAASSRFGGSSSTRSDMNSSGRPKRQLFATPYTTGRPPVGRSASPSHIPDPFGTPYIARGPYMPSSAASTSSRLLSRSTTSTIANPLLNLSTASTSTLVNKADDDDDEATAEKIVVKLEED